MKITAKHQIILDVIREEGGHIERDALIDILALEHGFTRRSVAAYIARSIFFGYWYNQEDACQMVFEASDMDAARPITVQYAGYEVFNAVLMVVTRDALGRWRTLPKRLAASSSSFQISTELPTSLRLIPLAVLTGSLSRLRSSWKISSRNQKDPERSGSFSSASRHFL